MAAECRIPRRLVERRCPRRLAAWRRFLAPFVALAFLLGLASNGAVQADAFAAHVVCPEDGAVLHAEAGAHGAAQVELRGELPHHHEFGCVLADLGGAPEVVFPPAAFILSPPAALLPDARAGPGRQLVVRDLLLLAPKTSPPMGA